MTTLTTIPFLVLVEAEVRRAGELHPPLASHDEALSVLDEEVAEVRVEVYKNSAKRNPADLLTELVQTAAMARRFAENTGVELALPNRSFAATAELAYRVNHREVGPVRGDHEGMTRLNRTVLHLWDNAKKGGPDLTGLQYETALALCVAHATCRRWAEDRGLCPRADGFCPPAEAGRVVVEAVVVAPPEPPAESPAEAPAESPAGPPAATPAAAPDAQEG